MTPEIILPRLNSVFQRTFFDPALTVQRETTASDVEGWDSLSHLRLLIFVEKEFSIALEGAEATRLKNVGDLVSLIQTKLAKA